MKYQIYVLWYEMEVYDAVVLLQDVVCIAFYIWFYGWCGLMIYSVHCSEYFSFSHLELDRVWYYLLVFMKELGVGPSSFWMFLLWFWDKWNTCNFLLEVLASGFFVYLVGSSDKVWWYVCVNIDQFKRAQNQKDQSCKLMGLWG